MLQSVTECYRVVQSGTGYYKVLQRKMEEFLKAADQGGDSAGGAWGRRRREGGDGAFWDMFVKGKVLSNQSCCT